MAGIQPTSGDIQFLAGSIAKNLKDWYQKAVDLKEYFDRTPDSALTAMGISQEDVTVLKSAMADLAYQRDTAFNSSNAVKQLWGTGA